jgi:hypothetical protein
MQRVLPEVLRRGKGQVFYFLQAVYIALKSQGFPVKDTASGS